MRPSEEVVFVAFLEYNKEALGLILLYTPVCIPLWKNNHLRNLSSFTFLNFSLNSFSASSNCLSVRGVRGEG